MSKVIELEAKAGQGLAKGWPKAGQGWPGAGQGLAKGWPRAGRGWPRLAKGWPRAGQGWSRAWLANGWPRAGQGLGWPWPRILDCGIKGCENNPGAEQTKTKQTTQY